MWGFGLFCLCVFVFFPKKIQLTCLLKDNINRCSYDNLGDAGHELGVTSVPVHLLGHPTHSPCSSVQHPVTLVKQLLWQLGYPSQKLGCSPQASLEHCTAAPCPGRAAAAEAELWSWPPLVFLIAAAHDKSEEQEPLGKKPISLETLPLLPDWCSRRS